MMPPRRRDFQSAFGAVLAFHIDEVLRAGIEMNFTRLVGRKLSLAGKVL